MSLLSRLYHRIADGFFAWRLRSMPGVCVDRTIRCHGMPIVTVAPGAKVVLGANVVLVSRSEATALGVAHPVVLRAMRPGSVLSIGADTGISGGSLCASESIVVGERCLLGANTTIVDTDFHVVDALPRRYSPASEATVRPIEIGDDVFIGTGAVILKGAKIGNGSVVGANTVVTGVVEPMSVVAGNPCRHVRKVRVPA